MLLISDCSGRSLFRHHCLFLLQLFSRQLSQCDEPPPSTMESEETLATVALVVSLVALVISVSQVAQQFLSTADGYRRCSPAVIGSWATLRHRQWVWPEFRFETVYSAPHITMIIDDDNNEDRSQRLSLLDLKYASYSGPTSSVNEEKILRTSVHPSHGVDEGHTASWLVLLRHLHALVTLYWPSSCSTCTEIPQYPSAGLTASKASREPTPLLSIPAVVFRTWTWDLMPPDLTRPPASSTLSDIILIGLRFGMTWRTVDPARGLLAADGDGYSLLGTESQGLGLVVRFTAAHRMHKPPSNIPSQASDKMFFGIIPGDPVFVQQDYSIVPDKPLGDGRLIDHGPPASLMTSVGVPNSMFLRIWRMVPTFELHNELVSLLCPFFPIPGCSAIHLASPVITATGSSAFHFWEGRFGLLRSLESNRVSGRDTAVKKAVNEFIRNLESRFPDDFYSRWGQTAIEAAGQARMELVDCCREAYDASTAFFRARKYDAIVGRSKDGKPTSRYMQLVGAHLTMSVDAIEEVRRKLKEDRDAHGQRTQSQQQVKYDLEALSYGYFAEELYLYAGEYVTRIGRSDSGVVKYMRDRKTPESDEATEDAWWMLMLRGIAWDMSIMVSGDLNSPVPSSLYYNKTPVWIL